MIDMKNFAPRRLLASAIFALLVAAFANALLAQQTLIAATDLPDAPSARLLQAATKESLGTISGNVSDIRGGLVAGAAITLAEKGHANERKIVSDSEGNFTFADLRPGSYTVVISSPGLETFQSPIIFLRAGEKYELPNVALPIATASTTVNVVMTQSQVADAELKFETTQRVFAVFPNFYTSFLWNAAPLNTRQKFKLSFRATTDPVAFVTAGLVAGIEQANNTFPDYGQGAEGFGKRYGAAYGDAFIGRTLGSAVFPTVFRQDPRYFYMGPASPTRARLKHALLAGLVARGDNGRWQPDYSHIAGNAAAGALSSVYHPASDSAGSLALDNALIGIGGGAFQGLIREFLWDHFTSKVPSYAKGKAVAATNP
jgi:hypothetical protein